VLDGIALLLAGANHSTSKDGKGIAAQVQDGADEFVITGEFDGFTVERAVPRTGAQRLSVSGCDQSGVTANQGFLDAKLGLSRNVLMALLDARPVLSRDPKEQFDTLLKAIKAADLVPTDWLKQQGIKKFLGPGHVDDLIKEHKTVNLRDLNREEKRLQSPIVSTAPNPFEGAGCPPGITTPSQARAAADQRKVELAKLNERRAALEAEQRKVQAQLAGEAEAEPETVSGKPSADQKDYQHTIKTKIPDYEANLRECNRQINQITSRIEELRREEVNLRSSIRQVRDHIEVLDASRKMTDCPTCGQKWPEGMTKKVLAAIQEQQGIVTDAEGNLKTKLREIELLVAQKKEVEQGKTFHDEALERFRGEVKAYEAAQSTRQQMNEVARKEAEARLKEIGGDLAELLVGEGDKPSAIEKAQAKVDNWNEFISRMQAYQGAAAEAEKQESTRQADLRKLTTELRPREDRIVHELENIRDGLVKDHVEPFVERVNRVMAALGQPAMAYELEQGWVSGGRGAASLSGGQTGMCFEAAFRVAVAETTEFPLVLLDNYSPVDEGVQGRLAKLLYESGKQVITTLTSKNREAYEVKFRSFPPDMTGLWVSIDGGVSAVEPLRAEAKAA
jgi:hypothetical protein